MIFPYATVKKSLFHHREADAYHDHVTLKNDQAVVRTTNYAEYHLDYALKTLFTDRRGLRNASCVGYPVRNGINTSQEEVPINALRASPKRGMIP